MSTTERSECSPTSPREARRFIETTLTGWNIEQPVETAELLTSELVTNAFLHGKDERPLLVVVRTGTSIHVEVHDHSPVEPVVKEPDPGRIGGLGMHLVDSKAKCWGVEHHAADGKAVWFELDCDAA